MFRGDISHATSCKFSLTSSEVRWRVLSKMEAVFNIILEELNTTTDSNYLDTIGAILMSARSDRQQRPALGTSRISNYVVVER